MLTANEQKTARTAAAANYRGKSPLSRQELKKAPRSVATDARTTPARTLDFRLQAYQQGG